MKSNVIAHVQKMSGWRNKLSLEMNCNDDCDSLEMIPRDLLQHCQTMGNKKFSYLHKGIFFYLIEIYKDYDFPNNQNGANLKRMISKNKNAINVNEKSRYVCTVKSVGILMDKIKDDAHQTEQDLPIHQTSIAQL